MHPSWDTFDRDFSLESEIDDEGRVFKNPRNSPSPQCPRDEEQALLLGQKCLRKCSSDEDCKSKKKKCRCDGMCGMSCIKPERECDALVSPELGSVSFTGRFFGDRATYSCEPGFHLLGLRERTCQADGSWSGRPPVCRQNIYCTEPPHIEHARHNALPEQLTFDLESTLQYHCTSGYVPGNGFPRAKCLDVDGVASWYGPDITCEPRSCGAPADIPQGWHAGECHTFGCRVAYHCAEGFELVGRQERYCLADGTWSPRELPSCVPVQCPVPEDPPNGKAIFTSCSYNSVVSYECNYGYTLVGDTTRRCGADRKWSGAQPHCKEINCGHPGPLYNGWLENIEGGTGLGASIIFRCHDGMTLEGNTSTVCQIDGKWRYQPPKCLAPCVVPKVQKGRVIRLTKNGSEIPLETSHVVPHGDRLAVDCAPQYEFLHNNTPVICNNGTWTLIPRCDPARCKVMPKPPRNGMVIAPKTEHGMKARYKCKDGYTLKGGLMAECRFGNWTGEKPTCKEVYCPFPGYVENGKVMLVGNMGVYDYRPYVRKVTNNKQIMYECNRGYTLLDGPPGATCIGGRWSPKELPRCVRGMHPRLRWSRSIREERALAASGTVKIQKKPPPPPKEREREREREREKEKEKEQEMELAKQKKEEQEKEKQEEKERGQTEREHRNRNRDKSKKGRKSRKRGGKGKGPCETLANDPVLEVEITKIGRDRNHTYSSGTIIKVACSKGYDLNIGSNVTIKCVRGRWKPTKPECLISPCHIPFTENGIYERLSLDRVTGILLSQTTAIQSGDVVQFSCRPGYNIKGPGNLRCWHGRWSVTTMPKCAPAPCELPVIQGGQYLLGYRAGLTIANGSSVTFQCGNDHGRASPQTVECILGELRPRFPECHSGGDVIRGSSFSFDRSSSVKEHDVVFKGGSDITKGGDIIIDLPAGFRRSCGPPARVQGSLVYRDGEPIRESERSFPDGTEVIFNCIASINEKTTWRIICEDGSWVGRSLNCDADDYGESKVTIIRNTTCTFRNSEPNVVSFFNDQQITEEVVEFPAGSVLVSRCVDIGKYAMIGSSRRRCVNGAWDGQKPVCFGLNQENDYALSYQYVTMIWMSSTDGRALPFYAREQIFNSSPVEKPPTILFRHQVGPIAQSNDGRLIVYPSTILHMECLWIRRFGPPKWVVSHNYRKYPQGWTTDPGRDSQLEYRLSIYHANKDDSGIYTCVTPMRHSHSVEIIVEAIHCQPIPPRRGLNLSTPKTKMNTRVVFTCANGNSLIGAPEITCLPSGNWSAPVPICESIECADLINLTDSHLQVSIVSREVGGRAAFSCRQGFGLRGPAESVCLQSGDWSLPLPVCEEVQCNTPSTPDNGYIQGNGPFKAGDVVQFNCNPEYMMEGQPIIACQENGRWSGSVPKCVQACPYPGTTISGRMSAVKFYYKIGETVSFTCDEGLELRGAPMLRCLRNGKWSNAIPTCVHLSGNRNR